MQAIPLAFGSLASTLGSVIGAVGTVVSAVSANNEARYRAAVATSNAKIAEDNARQSTHLTAMQAQAQDMEAQQELGDVVAQASASGLDVGVGSTLLRRKSLEELAAKDRGFTIYAGEKEAQGYRQQAAEFRGDAASEKRAGKMALFSGVTGLLSSNLISDAPKTNPAKAAKLVRPKRNPIYAGA